MKKNWLSTVVVFFAVGAVGFWVFFYTQTAPESQNYNFLLLKKDAAAQNKQLYIKGGGGSLKNAGGGGG
ncbi:hypothetical protein ACVGXN_00320, partial [Enterobacter hormaechei]